MDAKDVSDQPDFRPWLDQVLANAESAARRQGERPHDLLPSWLLVPQFMMSLQRTEEIAAAADDTNCMLYTSQIPAPYLPCVKAVNDLQPLMVKQMTLETHHRGKKVTVRALTPSDRMNAVMAIVEDEEGTPVLLQLYNQPEEHQVSKRNILQKETVYIVKEPFFKVTTNGSYSLRVDHVSDIMRLSDDDERIPRKWRQSSRNLTAGSKESRMRGNSAVQSRSWGEAESMYSFAICAAKTREEDQLAHLNRSLANLRLERPEKALQDALKGTSENSKPSEKAVFREAKALYALGKYDECLERFQELVASYPHNEDARSELGRAKKRLQEQQTGDYKFSEMYRQAKATPPIIDCATYVGPVDVRSSPGRGRGLFTTQPVKAGQLLLCEKAFCYSYASNENLASRKNIRILMNLTTKRMSMGGQAYLISQIVQKLYHNPESAAPFKELYCGDYVTVSPTEVDGKPIVDSFLVERIVRLNNFGAPRSSRQHAEETNEQSAKSSEFETSGIWTTASHINHSCFANCDRSFIGDMLILRAAQDLEANTELLFPYRSNSSHASYEEVQKVLGSWGFTCDCTLCTDKKTTPLRTIKRRKALSQDFNDMLEAAANFLPPLGRARSLLQQLHKTYPSSNGRHAPRLDLANEYLVVGTILNHMHRPGEAIPMLIKGLEALDYAILACPPGDASKSPVLEITRWGQPHEMVVGAFHHLCEAYKIVCPRLATIARRYAEVSYSIMYGENDTFSSAYGEPT